MAASQGGRPGGGVAEQGEIGFHRVRVVAKDTDHLVADFGGVDRCQQGRVPEQSGNFSR